MVRLTGFADEASDDLGGQIEVTRQLGWHAIEARSVWGRNIVDLPDAEFERVGHELSAAGVRVNAIGSTIANWGKALDEPESEATGAIERAIPRMQALGARHIRIMSWKVIFDEDGHATADQRDAERIRRLNEICRRLASEGLVAVHENCATWGGMSVEHTLRMLDAVPDLRLVFDTGNPPLTPDCSKPFPYPMQSTREFWDAVKERVAHVHIKDARFDADTGDEIYCWPAEGDGDVEYVLRDLASMGYDGYLSIEPHMEVVFHDPSVTAAEDARRANYVEYGRRLEAVLTKNGLNFDRS